MGDDRGRTARQSLAALCLVAATTFAPALRAAPASAAVAGRLGGVNITSDGTNQSVASADFDRMATSGLNSASIVTWWEADSTQTQLTPDATAQDAIVTTAMDRARAANLQVVLYPLFKCSSCQWGWRGTVQPSNRAAFYDSYRAMINHYADLAQQHGATMLVIGSEMDSIQSDTAQWREVARQARAHFGGRLAYGANWGSLTAVHFWDAVDVVGLSAYFPLSTSATPSVDELERAWHEPTAANGHHRWFDEVANLASSTHKPVLFTEAGYRSMAYTAASPSDFTTQNPPDETGQRNAYQALLDTFAGASWWAGVQWWEWHVGGVNDTSFTPRGKAAEAMLGRWAAGPVPGGGGLVGTGPGSSPAGAHAPGAAKRTGAAPAGATGSLAGRGNGTPNEAGDIAVPGAGTAAADGAAADGGPGGWGRRRPSGHSSGPGAHIPLWVPASGQSPAVLSLAALPVAWLVRRRVLGPALRPVA